MRAIAISLFVFGAAGCGAARQSEPLVGTIQFSPSARAGRQVYAEHCYPCHPAGEAGVGPALNNKPVPGTAIKLQVRKGFGAMPAFNENIIDDRQLEDVVAYLKEQRGHGRRR